MDNKTDTTPKHGVLDLGNLEAVESFSARFARLGDLYILFNVDPAKPRHAQVAKHQPKFNIPFRLNGMLLLLVHNGSITTHINSEKHRLKKGHIFIVRPGSLMTISEIEPTTAYTALFINTTFLDSVNIDLHTIEIRPILSHPSPVLKLTATQTDIIRKYLDILHYNTRDTSDTVFAKLVARTLISSIVYELMRFIRKRIQPGTVAQSPTTTTVKSAAVKRPESLTRTQNYVFRFFSLLHIHYVRHRDLEFYARELCITPKYLSTIIKQATGQTAAQWINRVTIQEAKNLIRYTDKNIQETAYALNFPSQSAFGKYFKRVTGKSPAAYLRDPD